MRASIFSLLGLLVATVGTADADRKAVTLIGEPGQPVRVKDHLARGQITIIDFFSHRCPPCRKLAPQLELLASVRRDLAVRAVNVDRPGRQGIDFQSPVMRQYGIQALPHLMIFGRSGKMVVEGEEAHEQVERWLGGLRRGPPPVRSEDAGQRSPVDEPGEEGRHAGS